MTIAVVVVAVVAVVVDKTNMKSINCLSVLMVMINVITFGLAYGDHIKRLLLYYHMFIDT